MSSHVDLKITPLDLAPWPSSASSLGRQLSMLPLSPAFGTPSREQQVRLCNSIPHHGYPGDPFSSAAVLLAPLCICTVRMCYGKQADA